MNLRLARTIKGLTQEQLASIAGVDKRTISDLERGVNRKPSWETVSRIAQAFGVEPEDIFPVQPLTPDSAPSDESAS